MRPTSIEWAPHCNWLCVTTFDPVSSEGNVAFCDHTSQHNDSGASRNCAPTCIKWHPLKQFVAVGWDDGCVCFVPKGGPVSHTVLDVFTNSAKFVDWSHNGKLLMTLHSTSYIRIYEYSENRKGAIETILLNQLEFKEDITATCKRLVYEPQPKEEQQQLSVPDDELAFDTPIQKRAEIKKPLGRPIGSEFLFGTDVGTVFSIDGQQDRIIHKLDSHVLFLDYCEIISMILVFTKDLFIYHLAQGNIEGRCSEKIKVKLGGRPESYKMELSEGLLVMCYEEREMRVWDLIKEENTTISLDSSKTFSKDEKIICVTINSKKGAISGGTTEGNVAHWRRRKPHASLENAWKLQASSAIGNKIYYICWSPVTSSVALVTDKELVILEDDNFIVEMKGKVAAVQTSANSFILLNALTGVSQDLKLSISNVKGISLGEKQLVVWNEETIVTYDVQSSLATIQSTSFSCNTSSVVIANQTLYCIEKDKINARTLQGTVRQIISLPEIEGDPTVLDLNKHWMAVGTSHGFVRIYNLSSKNAIQEHNSKYAIENVPNFYKFISVKINPTGNRVACTFLEDPTTVAELLLIFDAESDSITYFSFDRGMTDLQEYEAQAELAHTSGGRPVTAAARKMARAKSRFQMMLHRPGEICWDEFDPRYLVVECNNVHADSDDNRLLSMFVTAEHGIQLQDVQRKSQQCGRLVAVSVPHFYFVKKSDWDDEEIRGEKTIGKSLVAKILREFNGVENCDDATKKAMMDFSFYLTLGSMDAAFKAIQYIKSESVWEQMASMSVKTRRLDVAMVCLGHMKNVRGARAVRKSQLAGEDESMQCAALAVELGMMEEAQSIYASHERWDLVNKLYQAQNLWPQAFNIAETKDRIHLRNTHYNYAKYLESKADKNSIEAAIENYEKAGVHHFEVFRMLGDNPKSMETYVRQKREPQLYKWWGFYLESRGDFDGAVNFYTFASDFYSMVRVKCAQGKVDEAAKIAEESKDKAACYLIGRLYESNGDIPNAVQFYTKARAVSSAIRLAREHDMKDKLANLSLMAGGNELVTTARYYEDIPGYAHMAVMLYHKAGMIGRALDLAFRTEQFSALDLITKDLDATTDPKILKRAAEFFESNQNYEKALTFLCFAKEYSAAVRLCRSRNVRVTEKFAEMMTPSKEFIPNDTERKKVLFDVAELCLQQGAYFAAAKKYTQAGDKLTAMRALLKSGDIQKIRFFANTARSKDIYILAANFLQTTNWQDDPAIIKDIETFYTKSQSFEHLANFYKSCAIMEAENWKSFDKASSALEMAIMCIERAESKGISSASLEHIKTEIARYRKQLEKLIKILSVMQTDTADGIRQLSTLAEESEEDDIVPCTRIFAMLIEEHAYKKNWKPAYRALGALQKKVPNIDLENYISTATLDQICDEMRVERVTKKRNTEAESDGDDEVDFSHSLRRQL
ncbi:unnamed protein product [Caenorhabditis bovis]|uniref:Uncharacterized protein n=1 Tax=Caenorhabditis bovis TaxID=2654633 RepID=A0A8S1DZ81_9PELO|nr:unnamed protein product [Caenorhabditis bovis]